MVDKAVQQFSSSQISGTMWSDNHLSSWEPTLEATADIKVVYNRRKESLSQEITIQHMISLLNRTGLRHGKIHVTWIVAMIRLKCVIQFFNNWSLTVTFSILRRVRSWSRRSQSCAQLFSRSWRRSESAGPTWRAQPRQRPANCLKITSLSQLWKATQTSTTSSPTWSSSPPSWNRHITCPPSMSSSRNSRQVSGLFKVSEKLLVPSLAN